MAQVMETEVGDPGLLQGHVEGCIDLPPSRSVGPGLRRCSSSPLASQGWVG